MPFSGDVVPKQEEYTFDTTEKGVEIIVPTCSYRMGVKEMGYGFLEICKFINSVTPSAK